MYKNKYSNNLMDIKALVKENIELKEERLYIFEAKCRKRTGTHI